MPFSKVAGINNQHKVVVYALSTCVWCRMTKEFLKDNKIEFEYLDVDTCDVKETEQARQTILSKGGSLNYPITIIDNSKVVTGFRKDLLKEALGL